jgi:luciferase family oxidoreductase group 1
MLDSRINIPISVLDLAVIKDGCCAADSFKDSLDLAQRVESLGYHRYWLAEHHNMISIASAATSVLIGYIAGGTSHMRVGAGGIMLPNHAPLVIAEQFGTLASLYPGRIDLGLGRAPGSDQATALALRRDVQAGHQFEETIKELQGYFQNENPKALVRAVPGEGLEIPMWILGSSTYSAHLAASMGLPYAFASHFAPDQLFQALRIYKSEFRPSAYLTSPYCMACVNVIAADTTKAANVLATSLQKLFMGIITNRRSPLQAPDPSFDLPPQIANALDRFLSCSFIGSDEDIAPELSDFIDKTGIDELMVTSHIYDQDSRIHSYELLKSI